MAPCSGGGFGPKSCRCTGHCTPLLLQQLLPPSAWLPAPALCSASQPRFTRPPAPIWQHDCLHTDTRSNEHPNHPFPKYSRLPAYTVISPFPIRPGPGQRRDAQLVQHHARQDRLRVRLPGGLMGEGGGRGKCGNTILSYCRTPGAWRIRVPGGQGSVVVCGGSGVMASIRMYISGKRHCNCTWWQLLGAGTHVRVRGPWTGGSGLSAGKEGEWRSVDGSAGVRAPPSDVEVMQGRNAETTFTRPQRACACISPCRLPPRNTLLRSHKC